MLTDGASAIKLSEIHCFKIAEIAISWLIYTQNSYMFERGESLVSCSVFYSKIGPKLRELYEHKEARFLTFLTSPILLLCYLDNSLHHYRGGGGLWGLMDCGFALIWGRFFDFDQISCRFFHNLRCADFW